MTKPLVSAVIPAYNGERFLRVCIDSALAQTYEPLEVVVVNDGSTDGTAAILAEYGDRIRVFHQENAGRSAAKNRAIMESRGEWIALLDQDDLWDPRKVETQLASAKPGDSVLHSDARVIDEAGVVTRNCWVTPGLAPFPQLADVIRQCPVLALTAMVRRDAGVAVGGFDEANKFGTDDWQLWLALAANHHTFRKVAAILASYRIHGDNASLNRPCMAMGDIYALRQTRLKFRSAFGRQETSEFHRQLHRFYFDSAWHQYNRCNYRAAAPGFCHAVWHCPLHLQSWLHAVACIVPFRKTLVPILRGLFTGRWRDLRRRRARISQQRLEG